MEHLKIKKLNIKKDIRRKRSFVPTDIPRNHAAHGKYIEDDLIKMIELSKETCQKFKFSPHLILKVELEKDTTLSEQLLDKLNKFGLKLIDEESKELKVLFSEDINIPDFLQKLNDYKQGKKALIHVANKDIFNIIKSISPWDSEDRIIDLEIKIKQEYYDVYLWIFDTIEENRLKYKEFETEINELDIRICDNYISTSVVVVRIFGDENSIKILKEHTLVYQISNIPNYTIARTIPFIEKNLDISKLSFDNSNLDSNTSSSICVIDSGIFKGHPLLKGVVGDSKVFFGSTEDDNDNDGHGTMVASICAYGDISIDKEFKPEIYLFNAKIHNGDYESEFNLCMNELIKEGFDLSFEQQELLEEYYLKILSLDDVINHKLNESYTKNQQNHLKIILTRYYGIYSKLIPNQMKSIVEYFHSNYKCKIYNLSQGDRNQVFKGGKPNAWSCVLDEIQNELDVLFVISAGNYYPEIDYDINKLEENYPSYFYCNSNSKIIEPANSALSVTVGSLAISDNVINYRDDEISGIPISKKNEISSFSRVGYGSNGSIKPDFMHYGGDRYISNRIGNKEFSFNANYGISLLGFHNLINDSIFVRNFGTSFAAPYISHLAGKILNKYKDSSMNLVRALLTYSADQPIELQSILDKTIKDKKIDDILSEFKRKHDKTDIFDTKRMKYFSYGYGIPDENTLLNSDSNRVVLMSDIHKKDELLEPDGFHIYEIPILEEFSTSKGKKNIDVALAFNPEVRKTRMEYLGTNIDFTLVRGKSIDDVYNVYSSQNGKKIKSEMFPNKFKCKCEILGTQIRNKGTLQKLSFKFSSRSNVYGDKYYLIINSIRKWSNKNLSYGLVVGVRSEEDIELYTKIREKISQPITRRVRVKS